jgi:hypothetical protein
MGFYDYKTEIEISGMIIPQYLSPNVTIVTYLTCNDITIDI